MAEEEIPSEREYSTTRLRWSAERGSCPLMDNPAVSDIVSDKRQVLKSSYEHPVHNFQ
jgi:hypothetical protein